MTIKGSRKALIGGKKQSKGKIYPSYWPCASCGRLFKEHLKFEVYDGHKYKGNWCYSTKEIQEEAGTPGKFIPVDNLTYVELKAKEKLG